MEIRARPKSNGYKAIMDAFAGLFLSGSGILGYILGLLLLFAVDRQGLFIPIAQRTYVSLAIGGILAIVGLKIELKDGDLKRPLVGVYQSIRSHVAPSPSHATP